MLDRRKPVRQPLEHTSTALQPRPLRREHLVGVDSASIRQTRRLRRLQVAVRHPEGVLRGGHLLQQQLCLRVVVLTIRHSAGEERDARRLHRRVFLCVIQGQRNHLRLPIRRGQFPVDVTEALRYQKSNRTHHENILLTLRSAVLDKTVHFQQQSRVLE